MQSMFVFREDRILILFSKVDIQMTSCIFSHDSITFHTPHAMLSLQPGSSMSRDKIHDASLQSQLQWSVTGERAYLFDDPTATYGLDLPETI